MQSSRAKTAIAVGVFSLLFIAVAARAGTLENVANRQGMKYVPHQVLVRFKPSANRASVRSYVQSTGGKLRHALVGQADSYVVELSPNRTVAQAVRAYRANPNVAHAQPNYIYHKLSTGTGPDDPRFDEQWALENTGQTIGGPTGTPGDDIGATQAWQYRTDCSNITVAVVDSGVNYTHADLAANMWDGTKYHGHDFVDNDDDPMPTGGDEHGTHVAGIIGAVGNNGTAVSGVCWKASIMSVRVLGPGGFGTSAQISQGVLWAADHGARIINMSLGDVNDKDKIFENAIKHAGDEGVLVVVAAGNEDINVNPDAEPTLPCSFHLENMICVAALDPNYQLADFSNYGDKVVDVGAPGVDILSTWPGIAEKIDLAAWHRDGGWAIDDCEGQVLVNPADWCSDGQYADNVDAVAYQTFDLSSPQVLGARYGYFNNLELAPGDSLQVNHKAGSHPGNPFVNGTMDDKDTGETTDGAFHSNDEIGLANCVGHHCSIGFRLQTTSGQSAHGVAIKNFVLEKVIKGTDATEFLSGTSMASPVVAGVAALAWSIVPDKDYNAIRDAVMHSGDTIPALEGKTTTGRAVNVFKALKAANDAPTIKLEPTTLTAGRGETVSISIDASDPNQGLPQTLTYSVDPKPGHGTVSISADHKSATYTPDGGYVGTDSFGIKVDDGYTGTATANANVEVMPFSGGGSGALGWPLLLVLAATTTLIGLRRKKRLSR
jgi:subtilisin family serine protease